MNGKFTVFRKISIALLICRPPEDFCYKRAYGLEIRCFLGIIDEQDVSPRGAREEMLLGAVGFAQAPLVQVAHHRPLVEFLRDGNHYAVEGGAIPVSAVRGEDAVTYDSCITPASLRHQFGDGRGT